MKISQCILALDHFFLIVYEFWSLVVTLIFLMILLCGFLNIGTEAAPRKKGGAATA
jgi:hypothetical protein